LFEYSGNRGRKGYSRTAEAASGAGRLYRTHSKGWESELIARVSAHLRRSSKYSTGRREASATIESGNLVLDRNGCCIFRDGRVLELNAKEYKLLEYLMENPGRVFTKKQLYHKVWDEDLYYDDNTIMVHISHLRNKIEQDPKNPEHIITIRGIGYKFQKQIGVVQ